MRLAQTGDQPAYASLLVLLTGITRKFARARVGNAAWVDDVVQETLLAIHGARQTYDSARPFAPWFYAIASSRLIDVIRREKRVTAREVATDALPEIAAAPTRPMRPLTWKRFVPRSHRCRPRQRMVIEQLKFKDQSVRDVAGQLKMSESAVKVTAHRGYRVLRRLLEGRARED